tara:strand:+ start:8596 stop:8814 length:219 start_codon:yes stop_codon:yes gene_type:complete
MSKDDILGYSSHDWRKHTDSAVVCDSENGMMKVNDSKVYFTNPRTLQDEEVDLSRLVRVYVNNKTSQKRSVK